MAKRKRKVKKSLKIILFLLLVGIGVFVGLNFKQFKHDISEALPKNANDTIKEIQVVDLNSKTRPIAVMINNHNQARPYHSGLQEAYLIYEIIVEGGFTRYMAIYKDADVKAIGSVRSARHYYLDYALENDAVYVHWGWSDQAQNDISSLGVNNINGLNYENVYFYRDKDINVSLEHTGYTTMELINKAIDKLGYRKTTNKDLLFNYTTEPLNLKDMEDAQVANNVEITYSSSITSSYQYDSESKTYKRFVNDKAHVDYVTKKQYTFKNIITYQVSNHTIAGDDKGRQDLNNIGSGKGYYISEGYAVPITWEKKSRTSQTVYKFLNGEEIKINDGNTFIQIQPTGRKLSITE